MYGGVPVYEKPNALSAWACIADLHLFPFVFKKHRKTEAGKPEVLQFQVSKSCEMEQMEGAAGAKENLPFLSMPAVQPERARAKRKR